jgi:hypothetical protein
MLLLLFLTENWTEIGSTGAMLITKLWTSLAQMCKHVMMRFEAHDKGASEHDYHVNIIGASVHEYHGNEKSASVHD